MLPKVAKERKEEKLNLLHWKRLVLLETRTTWIQSCHQESLLNKDNFGCVTYHQPQQQELMWLIFKMNLIRNYNLDKPVKLVFAQLERSCIHNVSMSWSDKSQLTAQKEDSFWSESETKLKWQSRHIKLFTNHPLLTEWEKHWWRSSAKQKWKL